MSLALDIQGPSHSASHSPSSSTYEQWLHSLMTESRELYEVSDQQRELVIPRVPSEFREVKENTGCYEPQVVSIGPYHHGNKEFEKMEKLKTKLASNFVKAEGVIAEEMYHKVEELVGYARGCYAPELTHQFNDEKFTHMMFLDGYFMLEYLSSYLEEYGLNYEEILLVARDLMLLENQIPFQVLISLMRSRWRKDDQDLMRIFEIFFHDIRPIPLRRESFWEKISKFFPKSPRALISRSKYPPSVRISYDNVDHLLQLFHVHFTGEDLKTTSDRRTRRYRGTSWNRYHSVNELKNVGINFKPVYTGTFFDVKYKSTFVWGAIHVPPLRIGELTKPLFLNLAAYEACVGVHSGPLPSYLCFMRSLVDQPEDAKELRIQGILHTTLGSDDEIARLFKEMTTNLVPDPAAFISVKAAVESHYRNIFKRWILDSSALLVKYSFLYGFVVSAIEAYVAATQGKPVLGNCSSTNATQTHH